MPANSASATLDVPQLVTNLSVFSLAVSAVVAGVWKALKSVKAGEAPASAKPVNEVRAAMLVETATMVHWTESNRQLGEKLDRLIPEVVELCHQIERLRDRMDR